MTILKLSFIDLFFVLSEMDNVNKNKIRDYFYQYGIKETKENFINWNKYLIYVQVFNLIENCHIIKNDNYGLIIEIDFEESKHLLNDVTKIFFTRKLEQKRVERKLDTDTKLEICLLKFWFIKHRSCIHCSCRKFYGCPLQNGEESYCFICQIPIGYDIQEIEKIKNLSTIVNVYDSL